MKLEKHQKVALPVAETRAMRALSRTTPCPASHVAGTIWPDHKMKPQGAGAAASRILKVLVRKGQAAWVSREGAWGWVRTTGKF